MLSKIRGTKDLFDEEALSWEHMEKTCQSVFHQYGFTPLRTPIIESLELFKRSVGEVTDIVQKEMYQFIDRSNQEIALRPEGTAGIVRAVIENHWIPESGSLKVYYYGPMFRAERPQKGRQRQFHQIGAEYFGSSSIYADAETIEMLIRFLNTLGIQGSVLHLNNIGSAEDRKNYAALLKKYIEQNGIDKKLTPEEQARLQKNALRLLDSKNPELKDHLKNAPRIAENVSLESQQNFKELCQVLTDLQIPYTLNPNMVRGLDYYTHTVFELTHEALGAQDAIGAGGRYDRLVEELGGKPTPAVGFAVGVERLMIILEQSKKAQTTSRPSSFLIALGDAAKQKAFGILSDLRREGLSIEMDFDSRSLKANMRTADRKKANVVLILGEDELKNGVIQVKDMFSNQTDKQTQVPIAELPNFLKHKYPIDKGNVC